MSTQFSPPLGTRENRSSQMEQHAAAAMETGSFKQDDSAVKGNLDRNGLERKEARQRAHTSPPCDEDGKTRAAPFSDGAFARSRYSCQGWTSYAEQSSVAVDDLSLHIAELRRRWKEQSDNMMWSEELKTHKVEIHRLESQAEGWEQKFRHSQDQCEMVICEHDKATREIDRLHAAPRVERNLDVLVTQLRESLSALQVDNDDKAQTIAQMHYATNRETEQAAQMQNLSLVQNEAVSVPNANGTVSKAWEPATQLSRTGMGTRNPAIAPSRQKETANIMDHQRPCLANLKGACKFGEKCKFWHIPKCKGYSKGNCSKGDECIFVHSRPGAAAKDPKKKDAATTIPSMQRKQTPPASPKPKKAHVALAVSPLNF